MPTKLYNLRKRRWELRVKCDRLTARLETQLAKAKIVVAELKEVEKQIGRIKKRREG